MDNKATSEKNNTPNNPQAGRSGSVNGSLREPDGGQSALERDPIDAILALNIGDFIAENFISDELLNRISHRLADDPKQLRAQLEELINIYSIDKTLGILGLDTHSGFVIYDSIAASLAGLFEADACHVFQVSKQETGEQTLTLAGTSVSLENDTRWEIGIPTSSDDFLCRAYRFSAPQVISKAGSEKDWHPIDRLQQKKAYALLAAPLKEGGRSIGLLLFETYAENKDGVPFSDELVTLSNHTAQVLVTALRLQQLVADAREKLGANWTTSDTLVSLRAQITESIADLGIHQQAFVESLAAAVDARHHFTRGHSYRVGTLSRLIAEELNLNEKSIDLIEMAGLLGSVGKIRVPRHVIGKSETLKLEEWEALHEHPNVGVNLLMKINFLSETIPYVASQNERWDGSGSPEKLKGKNIPLGARILAVANAYQAMTSARPYRGDSLTHDDAMITLREESGMKWDPLVVDTLNAIPTELLR